MPRYFLDTHNGTNLSVDPEGCELAGPAEARSDAVKTLPELMRGESGDRNSTIAIKVRDETGKLIFVATLALHCTRME